MKFGEGMKPGTVEWERQRRQRRAQVDHWREAKRQTEPLPPIDGIFVRLLRLCSPSADTFIARNKRIAQPVMIFM